MKKHTHGETRSKCLLLPQASCPGCLPSSQSAKADHVNKAHVRDDDDDDHDDDDDDAKVPRLIM